MDGSQDGGGHPADPGGALSDWVMRQHAHPLAGPARASALSEIQTAARAAMEHWPVEIQERLPDTFVDRLSSDNPRRTWPRGPQWGAAICTWAFEFLAPLVALRHGPRGGGARHPRGWYPAGPAVRSCGGLAAWPTVWLRGSPSGGPLVVGCGGSLAHAQLTR